MPPNEAFRLLAGIAELCDGELSGQCAERALSLAVAMRKELHARRLPPVNDWRAALAYSYAGMLEAALESRNVEIARLEVAGLREHLPRENPGSPRAALP